ncbi:hypothetical protein GCM10011507_26050 [Edaphobacter acidisoli]|uniref:PEP-CTERM protein-sorting domain-containing protein n=1 Tax=Edaphobacter acidisoli TaxID=2040573 RepID=A0A916W765_9BACT|nr:PEP-CTERM sorting domain-containing protein [Edaphobacter acidisoli]GGA73232.1 hypothetical protein GCM10011507_26050 [Edaphobacter acidisoli]
MSLQLGSYVRMAGLVALAAAFVAGSSGRADTLLIQGEITGVSQSNGQSVLSVSLPTLDNLVLANYSSIDLQLSVTPGQEVVVDENSFFGFGVNFWRAGSTGATPAGGACTFSMTGSGPAPSGSGTCAIGTNAELIYYSDFQSFSAGDTFTQLDYVMNVPTNLPVLSGADFTPDSFESPGFNFHDPNGGTETEATMQSAATPEPGTLVLVGTALLSGAGLIRRRLQA